MEFSIADLLSYLSDTKNQTLKVLEKKLGCETPASVERLELALEILEKIGVVVKERGRYRRTIAEDLMEAKLRCSSKGFCFGLLDDKNIEDVYVRETSLSNAMNGDRVLVQVMKEASRRRSPEGIVKLVLERANSSVLARVKLTENGEYRAVPLDDRLLFEAILEGDREEIATALDRYVQVDVLHYPIGGEVTIGRIARVLGDANDFPTEMDIVSCKHGIWEEFPATVAAAGNLEATLPATLTNYRQDWRDRLTFSVSDSPSAEQAVSIHSPETGIWEVCLHIADAATYIELDSHLDREARRRGNTVFLGSERSAQLFPDGVWNACSLMPGHDRLAISIVLTIDAEGQTTAFQIRPTIVNVDAHFTPTTATGILAGSGECIQPLADCLQQLTNTVAPMLARQRRERGGFDINAIENSAKLIDDGRLGVVFNGSGEVVAALAEVAIAANQAFTTHCQTLDLPIIYSIQAPPHGGELKYLIELAHNLNLGFTSPNYRVGYPDTNRELSGESTQVMLQRLIASFDSAPSVRAMNHLLQNTLKPTLYSATAGSHFGLALEGYARVASPLHRYADLCNQRVLHSLFTNGRDRRSSRVKEALDLTSSTCQGQVNWNILTPNDREELVDSLNSAIGQINDRSKVAREAEKDFFGLQAVRQMNEFVGRVFQGTITRVQSYGLFVELEEFLMEGLVHVSSLKDDWYEFRPRYQCLVGRKNRITYRLGDRIEVQIKNVDYYRQQIDLHTLFDEEENETAEPDDLPPMDMP
jgi:ribonuclease R